VLQRSLFVAIGATLVIGGIAALLTGKTWFHAMPGSPFGWVFAPFSLIIGSLLVLLALRLGKEG